MGLQRYRNFFLFGLKTEIGASLYKLGCSQWGILVQILLRGQFLYYYECQFVLFVKQKPGFNSTVFNLSVIPSIHYKYVHTVLSLLKKNNSRLILLFAILTVTYIGVWAP